MDPRTPVIVGVGQLNHHAAGIADGLEPVDLMAESLRLAEQSAGIAGIASKVQSISVVPLISWRYRDPGQLVAARIGASPAETVTASMGGHTPIMLLNRAAKAIASGELASAIVVGGESWRTRNRARKTQTELEWTKQADDVRPTVALGGDELVMSHQAELALGLVMPTQMYPLFENALAHEAGRTPDEQRSWLATWWVRFAEAAERNPHAWKAEHLTADDIVRVDASNRMVGYPYNKRMVSNPDVDMAAGLIMCSVETARAWGVPEDRWIFIHSGTDGVDRLPSVRRDFHSSASMRVAGKAALTLAGLDADSVDHVDVYSCFPSAVEIAVNELGLSYDRPLTVYGGLCFAGGPWNNPVSHALAAMVDTLRGTDGATGLVTANGGIIGKHGFAVLGTEPPSSGFAWAHPQDQIDAEPAVTILEEYSGPAAIETWTVMHGRDGQPERAHAAVRTPAGERVWATTDDPDAMAGFESGDWVGAAVRVDAEHRLTLD